MSVNSRQAGQDRDGEGFRFTGNHMAFCMVAFFSVIIAVNLTMATLASKSWTGLVVKNSYVASQDFNRELAAAREQRERGWKGTITHVPGRIDFVLKSANGTPIRLDQALLELGRPAFEQQATALPLTYLGDGLYRADRDLEPGPWQLSVRADKDGVPYRLDTRIVVK